MTSENRCFISIFSIQLIQLSPNGDEYRLFSHLRGMRRRFSVRNASLDL